MREHTASPANPSVSFDEFVLDRRRGELRRNGQPVRLQEKPFQLLVALVELAGEVVSHEDLRARLWSADTFVDFDRNLITAVKKLRDALGDSAEHPRFVQTVPRRGYRFIAPIEAVSSAGEASAAIERTLSASGIRWLAAAAALAIMVATAGYAWQAVRARATADAASPEARVTVAVLQFQHAEEREQHSLSVVLKDEIVQLLANEPSGKVAVIAGRAVQKYHCNNASLRELGRELGARYVIEGNVSRAGKMLRISAILTSTTDQTLLAAKSAELPVEEATGSGAKIAQEIGRALLTRLSPPGGRQVSLLSANP